MPLSISFELSDRDLEHFTQAMNAARAAAAHKNADEIIAAASALLIEANKAQVPDFIAQRLDRLDALIAMMNDDGWRLPDEDKQRVLSALVYFADPKDVIPDSVPVLGFLDDAIMIKFIEREFRHELAAYRRFKQFRRGAEQRPWTSVARERLPVRLDAMRRKLREQVERRRRVDEFKGLIGF